MTTTKSEPLTLSVKAFSVPQWAPSVWSTLDNLMLNSLTENQQITILPEIATAKIEPRIEESMALEFPFLKDTCIYAGQNFRFQIFVANSTDNDVVYNISLKIQVQSTSSIEPKNLHYPTQKPLAQLSPCESFQTVVEHRFDFPEQYKLVCEIHYSLMNTSSRVSMESNNNTNDSFKSIVRAFLLDILAPFQVRDKVEVTCDNIYIQCTIENNIASCVSLYRTELTNVPQKYVARRIVSLTDYERGGTAILKSRESINVLFCLQLCSSEDAAKNAISSTEDHGCLGRLSIEWYITGHGTGVFDKHAIHAPKTLIEEALSAVPAFLRLLECPNSISVEELFTLTLECVNRGSSPLAASLVFIEDILTPFYVQGSTELTLPIIAPYKTTTVTVKLMAHIPGLQTLKGIILRDTVTQKVLHAPAQLASILVF